MKKVAALYVRTDGNYFDVLGVDPWDIARDAKNYRGPYPVIAHPPCQRWCMLAALNFKRFGHRIGDDAGCFKHALKMVREYGGVLEHPAFSRAWPHFKLLRPIHGAWTFFDGAWVTQISQRAYGHRAKKMTWLYYVGKRAPPSMDWRRPKPIRQVGYVYWGKNNPPPVSKKESITTPPKFRDALIAMARHCGGAPVAATDRRRLAA